MGIEPTNHMISMRLYGFEDRGQHQLSKHFQFEKSGKYRFCRIIPFCFHPRYRFSSKRIQSDVEVNYF